MEDQQLIELRELKAKLLEKTENLLKKLKNKENEDKSSIKFAPDTIKEIISEENKSHKHKLLKVTRKVTGIRFQNMDRELLDDNIFKYTAELITSALKFFVELSVKLKGEKGFEIKDITCHFIDIDKCYLLEIQFWIQDFSRRKNFSLLTSAVSWYSEQSRVRKSILELLKQRKYGTYEQCQEGSGGIILFIHSPKNVEQDLSISLKKVYLKIQWSLIFFEKLWQCEHVFEICPTPQGMDFASQNQDLMRSFCKKCITNNELLDLWQKMCNAIDSYENNEDDLQQDTTKE
ncbi:uncharacterized protein LOC117226270 [Megalopta genalis]|uniref:uncharacterized protein LOC117226270 n=1 Tax=Megalopta genalis TaxID=115081 RepID=UPI003FD0712E